jgi:hypothetical protein
MEITLEQLEEIEFVFTYYGESSSGGWYCPVCGQPEEAKFFREKARHTEDCWLGKLIKEGK